MARKAKTERVFMARREYDYGVGLGGGHYEPGQLIRPLGLINDFRIFASDATAYAMPYEGDSIVCGTDGCIAEFANDGYLARHRLRKHAPDIEYRLRQQSMAAEVVRRTEERGETIGGYPVTDVRSGPGGDVPYVGMQR